MTRPERARKRRREKTGHGRSQWRLTRPRASPQRRREKAGHAAAAMTGPVKNDARGV